MVDPRSEPPPYPRLSEGEHIDLKCACSVEGERGSSDRSSSCYDILNQENPLPGDEGRVVDAKYVTHTP